MEQSISNFVSSHSEEIFYYFIYYNIKYEGAEWVCLSNSCVYVYIFRCNVFYSDI